MYKNKNRFIFSNITVYFNVIYAILLHDYARNVPFILYYFQPKWIQIELNITQYVALYNVS